MSTGTSERTVPPPRGPVGSEDLSRPDWTVAARNTDGVIALDKNETTDPEFRERVTGLLASLPAKAAIEYPECAPYYHLLADDLGLEPRNLLFTAGADGAIRLVFEAFLEASQTVMLTAPTFAMLPIYARMYGGDIVELEYEATESGPSLETGRVLEALRQHRPRIFCLSNPDSPTGTIFAPDALGEIVETAAETETVILIDEAYFPFSAVTAIDRVGDFPNLVVARTFAKAWGLAGLRIGFAAAHPDMATVLHKVRPMYEVNGFALAAMAALIEHKDWVTTSVTRINAGKVFFLERMQGLGLRTLDCAGNFLHVDFGEGRDAVLAALDGRVLYKQSFPDPCLAGFSRFTSAPEAEMTQVADMIESAIG